jgi:hypothetical protein
MATPKDNPTPPPSQQDREKDKDSRSWDERVQDRPGWGGR